MNKKISLLTVVYCLALGMTIILAAIISKGKFMVSVIPMGTGMIITEPSVVLAYRKNAKRLQRDCDEREQQITEKSMKFAFYSMTFILSTYWAYDVAGAGTFLRFSSLIVCLLWGLFLGAYIINKIRL